MASEEDAQQDSANATDTKALCADLIFVLYDLHDTPCRSNIDQAAQMAEESHILWLLECISALQTCTSEKK